MKVLLKLFAKGLACPNCGHPMYAKEEIQMASGKWRVYYVCKNQKCLTTTHRYE